MSKTRGLGRWMFVTLVLGMMGSGTIQAAVVVTAPQSSDAVVDYAVAVLQERLTTLQGDDTDTPPLRVTLQPTAALEELGPEGYRLVCDGHTITVMATNAAGLRNGAMRLIEFVIGRTLPGVVNPDMVDVDFPIRRGQAAAWLRNPPPFDLSEKPFYSHRMFSLTCFALGVMDLVDTQRQEAFFSHAYSPPVTGGFRRSAEVWRTWCDWCARHRVNRIGNWPYSAGANWWEMALTPRTQGMSIYTPEEIEQAADIREGLFRHARARGLKPYLMNYVAGSPTKTIEQNHPQILGDFKPSVKAFCLSNSELTEVFRAQIQAIEARYPSLGGIHLRWWYESFACNCDRCSSQSNRTLLQRLTRVIAEASLSERADMELLLSGFLRIAGDKTFADSLPGSVFLQSKWGTDWQPYRDPGVPFEKISELQQRFVISHCIPAEEYHSIGSLQCRSMQAGIRKYAAARLQVSNLVGFAAALGEMDTQWVTALDFMAFSKLQWDPGATDVDALARNYFVAYYGTEAGEAIARAMQLTQDAWEPYIVDFAHLTTYREYARFFDMFGFEKVRTLPAEFLQTRVPMMRKMADTLATALQLVEQAASAVPPEHEQHYRDLHLQTRIFAHFFRGREYMAAAFLARREGRVDVMVDYLQKLHALNRKIYDDASVKPNIADDFEFEGQTTPHYVTRVMDENHSIEEMLAAPALAEMRRDAEASIVVMGTSVPQSVLGEVGSRGTVNLLLPEGFQKTMVAAELAFELTDIDGTEPGQECQVHFAGATLAVPPSGNGLTRQYQFFIDPADLTVGSNVAIFELTGRPEDTRGFIIATCKLRLYGIESTR